MTLTYYGPETAFLLVGGKNLTGDTFSLKDGVEEITEEVGPFGRSMNVNKGVGIGQIALEAQGGLYDDRTAGNIEALQGLSGAQQLVSYGFVETDVGADVVMLDGVVVTKFNRVLTRDGLTKAEPEFVVSATYQRGKVLHGLTTETADGDTTATSVDNAASSANGAVADMHVPELDLDGHTGLVVQVLGSADDITFAPLSGGTFAAVTVAGTAERLTISGTIPRYLAAGWDFTGSPSGSTPSAVPYVAVHRL